MLIFHPNQAGSLQGSHGVSCDILAVNGPGSGSGWQQNKQNWAPHAVIGQWSRMECWSSAVCNLARLHPFVVVVRHCGHTAASPRSSSSDRPTRPAGIHTLPRLCSRVPQGWLEADTTHTYVRRRTHATQSQTRYMRKAAPPRDASSHHAQDVARRHQQNAAHGQEHVVVEMICESAKEDCGLSKEMTII